MSCDNYREVEERIDWFLAPKNYPSRSGMCAQHTWHALGGSQSNPCPVAWGTPDANAVVNKLRAAGKLYTKDLMSPPRGAEVVWQYGSYGHAALSLGNGKIATTDPSNGKPTGIEDITYPKRWGAGNGGRPTGWSDYYSGTTYSVGEDDMPLTDEDIEKIAKAVNRTLGDWKADGDVQDAASDPPQTGSTRLRSIAKVTDAVVITPGE